MKKPKERKAMAQVAINNSKENNNTSTEKDNISATNAGCGGMIGQANESCRSNQI